MSPPCCCPQLLGSLLEVNPAYVQRVEAMNLAPQFFTFLSLDHANNNVHNIRLCRQIMVSGSLTPGQLRELQVVQKVTAVLTYAHQNNVEPFLEPVLDLCLAIINRDADDTRAGASQGQLLQQLLPQLHVFAHLCLHAEPPVSASASACVLALVVCYPADTVQWLCSREGASVLCEALAGSSKASPNAQTQQNLLSAIAIFGGPEVRLEGRVAPNAELSQLIEIIKQLTNAPSDLRHSTLQALAALSNLLPR